MKPLAPRPISLSLPQTAEVTALVCLVSYRWPCPARPWLCPLVLPVWVTSSHGWITMFQQLSPLNPFNLQSSLFSSSFFLLFPLVLLLDFDRRDQDGWMTASLTRLWIFCFCLDEFEKHTHSIQIQVCVCPAASVSQLWLQWGLALVSWW